MVLGSGENLQRSDMWQSVDQTSGWRWRGLYKQDDLAPLSIPFFFPSIAVLWGPLSGTEFSFCLEWIPGKVMQFRWENKRSEVIKKYIQGNRWGLGECFLMGKQKHLASFFLWFCVCVWGGGKTVSRSPGLLQTYYVGCSWTTNPLTSEVMDIFTTNNN